MSSNCGSYHPVFNRIIIVVVRTNHMFVSHCTCNTETQTTQVGSHGIEASYITIHLYDFLAIYSIKYHTCTVIYIHT